MISARLVAWRFVLISAAFVPVLACGSGKTRDPVELVLVRVEPGAGQSGVARNSPIRLTFNTTVLPSSVSEQSIQIRYETVFDSNEQPEGIFIVSGNIVEFDPTRTARDLRHASGFRPDELIKVTVPILADGSNGEQYLRNIEGNPIADVGTANVIRFRTGEGWDDPVSGPPWALGIETNPPLDGLGLVPSTAAVTLVFTEPIDPDSLRLGENVFLRNDTLTSPLFRDDIPATVVHDGSLTRFSFIPQYSYGEGPFQISVEFIDRKDPASINPYSTPTDLAGNNIQNFTFKATFQTRFDPDALQPPPPSPEPPPPAGPDSPIAFAYVSRPADHSDGPYSIMLSTSDGSTRQVLWHAPLKMGIAYLDWSPDLDPDVLGHQGMIVFHASRAPGALGSVPATGVYAIALDGSDPQLLVADSLTQPGLPTYLEIKGPVGWSPDGRLITYLAHTIENQIRAVRVGVVKSPGGGLKLKVLADTLIYSDKTKLPTGGSLDGVRVGLKDARVGWSPDLKPSEPGYEGRIVFGRHAGVGGVTTEPTGLIPVRISTSGHVTIGKRYYVEDRSGTVLGMSQQGWSPDGRYLVAQYMQSPTNQTPLVYDWWKIDLDGIELRELIFTRSAQGLDWSPDGQHFVWHESKLYRMTVHGPRTPIAVEIESGSKPTYPRWNPNWKPDLH